MSTPDDWATILPIPTDLKEEQARLYYPIGCVGSPTTADADTAIERVVGAHPILEALHQSYRPTIPFLTHAHSLRVLCVDPDRFIYSPRTPWVRFADGALVVGEPIRIEVEGDEAEKHVGLAIALSVASPVPLIPETSAVAVALRRYVERFFREGLPTESGRIHPGVNLPTAHIVSTFSKLAEEADRLRTRLTSLPADHDAIIEIPRQGSVLVLGADGTATGQARLSALCDKLRAAGRHPVLVRAHPDLPGRSVVQKAAAMALACEYVIVDDTEPSGHLVEVAQLLIGSTTPFVVLRKDGRYSTAMVQPLLRSYRWTSSVDYVDEFTGVARALECARQLSEERQATLDEDERWR